MAMNEKNDKRAILQFFNTALNKKNNAILSENKLEPTVISLMLFHK